MSASTSICSQLQCCWHVFTNSPPPPLCLALLSVRLLPQPLVDLLACEYALASCPTYNCSLVCASVYNYESTCDPTYKCVPTCTCSYEFPPIFKHAPIYKNPLENDAITPKLHKTKSLSSSQQNNSLLQLSSC